MKSKKELQRRYYDVSQFFGGYSNQDCEDIYGSMDAAIDTFILDASFADRAAVAIQLRALLHEFRDDDVLSERTPALALDVDDGIGRNISERVWLEEVAAKIERANASR